MTSPEDLSPEAPEPQPKSKVRQKLDPASDSKLAALLTSFHEAKKRAESADAEADEYLSQIKSMLATVSDGVDAFDIAADPHGGYPAFTYRYTPAGKTLDGAKLKSENPDTWESFAKERKGYWTFEAKKSGRGRKR